MSLLAGGHDALRCRRVWLGRLGGTRRRYVHQPRAQVHVRPVERHRINDALRPAAHLRATPCARATLVKHAPAVAAPERDEAERRAVAVGRRDARVGGETLPESHPVNVGAELLARTLDEPDGADGVEFAHDELEDLGREGRELQGLSHLQSFSNRAPFQFRLRWIERRGQFPPAKDAVSPSAGRPDDKEDRPARHARRAWAPQGLAAGTRLPGAAPIVVSCPSILQREPLPRPHAPAVCCPPREPRATVARSANRAPMARRAARCAKGEFVGDVDEREEFDEVVSPRSSADSEREHHE